MDSENIQILDKISELKGNHEQIISRVTTGQSRLDEIKVKKANLLKELAEMEERTRLIEDRKENYYPKVMKD
jgi:hypothetical protein